MLDAGTVMAPVIQKSPNFFAKFAIGIFFMSICVRNGRYIRQKFKVARLAHLKK